MTAEETLSHGQRRAILGGGVVVAALFLLAPLGTVIVLIIWLYLIACTVLIGCEFNAERERMACLDPLD